MLTDCFANSVEGVNVMAFGWGLSETKAWKIRRDDAVLACSREIKLRNWCDALGNLCNSHKAGALVVPASL